MYPCINSTINSQPVTDNNTVGLDANSLVPVSIAAYLAQSQGNSPDTRGKAILGTINSAPSVIPASGSAATVHAAPAP